jgi:hypothetical protein
MTFFQNQGLSQEHSHPNPHTYNLAFSPPLVSITTFAKKKISQLFFARTSIRNDNLKHQIPFIILSSPRHSKSLLSTFQPLELVSNQFTQIRARGRGSEGNAFGVCVCVAENSD